MQVQSFNFRNLGGNTGDLLNFKASVGSQSLLFDQPEAVVVNAAIVFSAAFVTSDSALDGFHAEHRRRAMRTGIGVIPLHAASLERQRVERLLVRYAEIGACIAPLATVWIDPTASAALVGDEVCELVFQSTPCFIGCALVKFGIELDAAVWPPSAASGRAHAWIPKNAHLSRKFRQFEASRSFHTPRGEAFIILERTSGCRSRRSLAAQPTRPAKFELRHTTGHNCETHNNAARV